MSSAKIYADFQNLDDFNRLRLTCAGTLEDLANGGIQLKEGMSLTFYTDDLDDNGQPDELLAEGTTHYNEDEGCWVASIDWSAIGHASEKQLQDSIPSPALKRQARQFTKREADVTKPVNQSVAKRGSEKRFL